MVKYLSAAVCGALDNELEKEVGFTIEQTMELAGLAVAQATYRVHPPSAGRRVLVVCGPGLNGMDGFACARDLSNYGYKVSVHNPRPGKHDHHKRLATQLHDLDVPFVDDFQSALKETDFIVDAIFGFTFPPGDPREPFASIIKAFSESSIPVISIDVPSAWNIETGPPESGPAKDFHPAALVSLLAPKPLAKFFKGRHFLGTRVVSPKMQKKYNLELPEYKGVDLVVEYSKEGN